MSENLVIDNVAVDDRSMVSASDYYCDYVRHGGTKVYQEYIQWCERHFDQGTKTVLADFMKDHFERFCLMAKWSNDYWRGVNTDGAK